MMLRPDPVNAVLIVSVPVTFCLLVGTLFAAQPTIERVVHDYESVSTVAPRFDHDGTQLVCGYRDGTVVVWDLATGRRKTTFKREGKNILPKMVEFSQEGREILAMYSDGTLVEWDIASGRKVRSVAFPGPAEPTVLSSDGKYLLMEDEASSWAALWDTTSGKKVSVIREAFGPSLLAFSSDSRQILVAGYDAAASVERITGKKRWTLKLALESVPLAFSRDGRMVLVFEWGAEAEDNRVTLFDGLTGEKVFLIREECNAAAFGPDARQILTGGPEGRSIVWDVQKKRKIRLFERSAKTDPGLIYGVSFGVLGVSFSGDGKLAASYFVDERVILWDPATAKRLRSFHQRVIRPREP